MKRTLSGVLAFLLVLSLLPTGLFTTTANADTSGYYTYTITDGKVTITDCDTSISGAITIPSTLRGYPVTAIGDSAFSWCDRLTSITIPDSVTTIGDDVFDSCTGLTGIWVDEENPSYASDACGALHNKEKTQLIQVPGGIRGSYRISNSVTTIGDSAFRNCFSLTSITIPDSVTAIGNFAFEYCDSLTSITIPDSVTNIGDEAFYCCNSLTGIWVDEENPSYASDACGALHNKEKTKLIQVPGGIQGSYRISDSVTTIGNSAFTWGGLTSVTIPDGVTTIGDSAFYWCESLTSITIPDSVTTIGNYAFSQCYSLTSVTIPDSVTSIGSYAFSDCTSLTSVHITDITAWCRISFSNASSNPLYYAKKLYVNGEQLTDLIIPNSVSVITGYAFYKCTSLTSVTIPDGVTSIGNSAFHSCAGLTSVTISDSVTAIGNGAFAYCDSLTSVTIPDGIKTIDRTTFIDCDSLTSVIIPVSVTSIADYAFDYCESLKDIWYSGTQAQMKKIKMGFGSSYLSNAQWHYNTCALEEHTYKGDNGQCTKCDWIKCVGEKHIYTDGCDTVCNICGYIRIDAHSYDNTCDTDCNHCGNIRVITHTYDYTCDATCNVCAFVRTELEHIYDNDCDVVCNNCLFERPVADHQYTLNGELTCSRCKYSKAPSAPTVFAFTTDSLTLASKVGLEYSKDGITWQDSPTFNNLKQNKQYTFYQRVKASEAAFVSECSAVLTVDFSTKTIRYDANGGQNAPDSQAAFSSTTVTLSASVPTRAGFQFAGWGTKESCGKQYAPNEQLLLTEDITFYALWGEHCATCQGAGKVVESSACTCGNGKVTSTTRYCTSCNRMNCITIVQTGYQGSYTKCTACGGINTGSSYTTTSSHAVCNGTGKITTSKTCNTCAGSGIKDSQVPSPVITSYTDTGVTLLPMDGYEYSKDGVVWQQSNIFENLSPATSYSFYCRVAATKDAPFGLPGKSTTVKTDKSKQTQIPNPPVVESFTANSITLAAVDGCEYSKDGTKWQASNVFDSLSCGTQYTFYQRYKETATTYAGKSSQALVTKTDKGSQGKPSAPTLSRKTHNSVTLYAQSGYEYSCDGVNWQTSSIFTGLSAETNYVFYQRKAETATYYASAASPALTVKTDEAPPYTPGDVTGDNKINSLDGLLLMRYLNGWNVTINSPEAMDVNADGKINSLDGLILMRYLNGWNVTLG